MSPPRSDLYDAFFIVVRDECVMRQERHVFSFGLGKKNPVEGILMRPGILGANESFKRIDMLIPDFKLQKTRFPAKGGQFLAGELYLIRMIGMLDGNLPYGGCAVIDGLSLKCVGKRQLTAIQMIPKNYRYGLEIVDTDRLGMVS